MKDIFGFETWEYFWDVQQPSLITLFWNNIKDILAEFKSR